MKKEKEIRKKSLFDRCVNVLGVVAVPVAIVAGAWLIKRELTALVDETANNAFILDDLVHEVQLQ